MPTLMTPNEIVSFNQLTWRTRLQKNQKIGLLIVVLMVNIMVVGMAVAHLWFSWYALESQAAGEADNLAKLTAQNVESHLQKIDLALRMVLKDVVINNGEELIEPLSMKAFNETEPSLVDASSPSMRLIDKDGFLVAGPGVDKKLKISIAERDYFQDLKTGKSASLVVGAPVLGKVTGTWFLPMLRPIKATDGSFAGIVQGSAPMALLRAQAELNLRENSLFNIFDSQLHLLVRFVKAHETQIAPGLTLTGAIPRRAVHSDQDFLPAIRNVSAIDGVERLTATQRLKIAPWFVSAGVPVADFEALWYRDLEHVIVILIIFLVVSAVLTWHLRRGMELQLQGLRQIEFLAYYDALTQVPNRKLLTERLLQSMGQARRNKTKSALLYLDLDHFKLINDTLGHAAGDAFLKETAKRMALCIRECDTLGRQGGDEFLVILDDLESAEAVNPVIVKLLECMNESFLIDGHEVQTSVSIGVVLYPDDGLDFETLGKKADVAMYKAKEMGRNGYCFFDEAMNTSVHERLEMTSALTKAVSRGEFLLHYQPQIDLNTNAMVGVEALLRWNHPQFGMVSPGRFIPLAEQCGLIIPIGRWVLEEACRQAVAWQGQGLPAFTMAVNLSAAQFARGDIENTVNQALLQSGLMPELLELELTESIMMNDTDEVLSTLKRLNAKGVQMSIDDFGTGYSSLSYLRSFRFDKLKIDQSFTGGLLSNEEDEAIITAIIQLARSLKFKTIAEGVESEPILQKLYEMGCDEAQGYYFAKPLPADKLVDFFKQHSLQVS